MEILTFLFEGKEVKQLLIIERKKKILILCIHSYNLAYEQNSSKYRAIKCWVYFGFI